MNLTEVVIASYLEPGLVERIAAADSRVHVTYEPSLLPVPRYPCDHTGTPPALSDEQLDRWRAIVSGAEVLFDFDWHEPSTLPERSESNSAWSEVNGWNVTESSFAASALW